MKKQTKRIDEIADNVSHAEGDITEIKQAIKETAAISSTQFSSLQLKQESLEKKHMDDMEQFHLQQANIGFELKDTTEVVKQISDKQKSTEEKIQVTKKQLSEEVEDTRETIRQLSLQEKEIQDDVNVLIEDYEGIKLDVTKVKEDISLIQQQSELHNIVIVIQAEIFLI